MNTSNFFRSAGRALGMALAFALIHTVASAQSPIVVSSTIGLPGTAVNFPFNDVAGFFTLNASTPTVTLGTFDFSNAVANNALPTAIGDVGIALTVYSLNTQNPPSQNGDFNELELQLNGTGANSSLSLLTGIFLNGFAPSQIDTESFNYAATGAQGAAILSFLNQTGGVITASIDDLNPGLSQTDAFVGGNMTLSFSVPFSPVQWLGIAAILLMAGAKIGWRRIPSLAGL